MKNAMLMILVLGLGVGLHTAEVTRMAPMGTAFTYQGRLIDDGIPADGQYDFRFTLCDPDAAFCFDPPVTKEDVEVSEGLFTVQLDFGSGADRFNGEKRTLQIEVRPGASTGAYSLLSPNQELTPAPYAISSDKLDGSQPSELLIPSYHAIDGLTCSNAQHKAYGNKFGWIYVTPHETKDGNSICMRYGLECSEVVRCISSGPSGCNTWQYGNLCTTGPIFGRYWISSSYAQNADAYACCY